MDKLLTFDLEIAKEVDIKNWRFHRPLGIACAGFYRPYHETAFIMSPPIESPLIIADYLINSVYEGYTLITCNGTGFDLDILAEECRDLKLAKQLAKLALTSIDVQLSVFCEKGVWVSQERLCDGMNVPYKKLLDASQIPVLWQKGDSESQQLVLDKLTQDVTSLMQLYQAIMEQQAVKWYNSKGKLIEWHLKLGHFPTVAEAIIKADPNVGWWTSRMTFRQALWEELKWIAETLSLED